MKLNKSLGQNFFNNPNLADWIVEQVAKENPKTVIEIGPGDGYFSKRLYDKTSNLVLIEKDQELAKLMQLKLPNATVYNTDILEWDLEKHSFEAPLVVYGSLPYNISKMIIAQFIRYKCISKMYFIIQKEVAQKYISKDAETSILSLTAGLYADFKLLKIIKPGSFIPKPKVDSALIEITPLKQPRYHDIPKFERIVKTAFSSPRKTIRNNLKDLDTSAIDEKQLARRPETFTIDEFIGLVDQIVL